MLDEEGHVAITDFGLSATGIGTDKNWAFSMCGTPAYVAPEIL